jgi:hypothetical protein
MSLEIDGAETELRRPVGSQSVAARLPACAVMAGAGATKVTVREYKRVRAAAGRHCVVPAGVLDQPAAAAVALMSIPGPANNLLPGLRAAMSMRRMAEAVSKEVCARGSMNAVRRGRVERGGTTHQGQVAQRRARPCMDGPSRR